MHLAFRLALREMRAGLKGFRIFVMCLALGVAAIAGVGSLTDALVAGLAADGGKLLGGDIELRLSHRQWTPAQEAYVKKHSRRISAVIGLRTMARGIGAKGIGAKGIGAGGAAERALVELKGVDGAYPLYGVMRLQGGGDLKSALAQKNGQWGAVVEAPLVRRLGLKIGDGLSIGELQLQLRAIIQAEPDRGASGFTLGPRVMISAPASFSQPIPCCHSFSISPGIPSSTYSLGTPIFRPRMSPVIAASKSGIEPSKSPAASLASPSALRTQGSPGPRSAPRCASDKNS